jgi:hypothetical protein
LLITDMNDRERRKFAEKAEALAASAGKLAESLRTGDDTEVLLHLAITGVSGTFITELGDIFKAAVAGVNIPDSPKGLVAPTKFSAPTHPLMNKGKEKA